MTFILLYLALGAFAGFVAGLFGVGGGLTLVPFLYMIFTAQGVPHEHLMHLALGTSMANITLTSISSMRAHHVHGAVRWDIVKAMAPGLVLGTFAGSQFAGIVPTRPLTADAAAPAGALAESWALRAAGGASPRGAAARPRLRLRSRALAMLASIIRASSPPGSSCGRRRSHSAAASA